MGGVDLVFSTHLLISREMDILGTSLECDLLLTSICRLGLPDAEPSLASHDDGTVETSAVVDATLQAPPTCTSTSYCDGSGSRP